MVIILFLLKLLQFIQDNLLQIEGPIKHLDGYIAVLPYSDDQWLRFFKLVDQEHVLQDEKFSSLKSRNENVDKLYLILSDALEKENTNYWIINLKKI